MPPAKGPVAAEDPGAAEPLPPHPFAVRHGPLPSATAAAAATSAAAGVTVAPLAIARLSVALMQTLLDSTASLAARLPHLGSPPRAAPTPVAATGGPPRSASPKVYGMGLGEAESAEEEEEEGDDLTARELRRLQQTQRFRDHMRAKGLAPADVAATASRLRLYRRLRQVDPAAFWLLVRQDARAGPESRQPSAAVLAADYLLSSAVNLLVVAVLALAWGEPYLPLAPKLLLSALAWWLTAAAWANGRSTAARLFDLWYEEPRWGHVAPAWRACLASLLELAYLAATLGAGLPVSLGLRAWGRRRQAVGELLAGVAAVQEVVAPRELGSSF